MEENKGKSWIIWLVVLVFIIAFGLFVFANLMFSNNSLSNLALDKIGLSTKDISRSANGGGTDPFADGMKALKDKNYPQAIDFFKTIPTDSESYTQARLYLAYALFEQKDYDNTIQNAQIVINQSTNIVNQQSAEWLQLQAMLAQGDADDDAFDRLLDKVASNEDHLLQAEATELHKSMNSFWRGLVF